MSKNLWQEQAEVYLPRAQKGEEAYVYVSVNERTFQVPKGRKVEVPLPVKERLDIMLDAQKKAEDFAAEMDKEAGGC